MSKRKLPTPDMARAGSAINTRTSFIERLAPYLLGVAVGCLLLGALFMGKRRAVQAQQGAQQGAQPAQAAPASTPAP